MSSRKSQNSILFLATLGVYLGLVLAGATPQVLAQAAMTRQFDVKDEIEFKDDLDNKPDQSLIDEIDLRAEQTTRLVSDSITNFLISFDTIAVDALVTSVAPIDTCEGVSSPSLKHQNRSFRSITNILSVNDLARGSLDPAATA